jgi:hypothetical protein
MHELLIFFGTLGGIIMFGVVGVIIGPIIAALFVTVWDIYGIAFKDVLPGVGTSDSAGEAENSKAEMRSGRSRFKKESADPNRGKRP